VYSKRWTTFLLTFWGATLADFGAAEAASILMMESLGMAEAMP
jgi:hypothetical protein